jgi:hypothetical protein
MTRRNILILSVLGLLAVAMALAPTQSGPGSDTAAPEDGGPPDSAVDRGDDPTRAGRARVRIFGARRGRAELDELEGLKAVSKIDRNAAIQRCA